MVVAVVPPLPPVAPAWGALVALLLVVGASSVAFWVLAVRSTAHRRWVALAEWAREAGFRFRPQALVDPPPPLDALRDVNVGVEICLFKGRTTLVQARTDPPRKNVAVGGPAGGDGAPRPDSAVAGSAADFRPPGGAAPSGMAGGAAGGEAGSPPRAEWHLLVRQLEAPWYPTGARPAKAAASFLDLFSLASYPLLGNSDRFVIYGTDSAAARALSRSSARALLPPDVGLLVAGRYLVLDFSGRPFDAIEFNRMLAVVEQIVAHLPAPE